jgi:hypothetical protein
MIAERQGIRIIGQWAKKREAAMPPIATLLNI